VGNKHFHRQPSPPCVSTHKSACAGPQRNITVSQAAVGARSACTEAESHACRSPGVARKKGNWLTKGDRTPGTHREAALIVLSPVRLFSG
jgi:hypothetical protein